MAGPFDAFQQGLMTGAQFGQQARQRREAREIGGMLQSGDREGAMRAAYGQGDLRTGQAIQQSLTEEQRAMAEQRTEALLGGVRYLQTIPPEQRPQAFSHMRAHLGAIFEPELLDQLAGADMSDQSLQAFGAALGQEAERLQLFQTRSGDIIGVNPTTGDNRLVYDGPEQTPDAPNGYRWTADGALEAIPGGPADPRVAGSLAASRRAPPRARSGGSSGGGSRQATPARPAAPSGGGSLPPGFTVRRR